VPSIRPGHVMPPVHPLTPILLEMIRGARCDRSERPIAALNRVVRQVVAGKDVEVGP
jgi:hypothetical protein